MTGAQHFRRIVWLWLISSVIFTPIVVFVLAPGMPPGNGTVEAAGQVSDNTVLLGLATPVALAVLVYFLYACVAFRERDQSVVLDGPPIRGNATIQLWWLVVTTVLVLFLAGFGSVQLAERRRRRWSGAEPDRGSGPGEDATRRSRSR